MIRRSGKQVNIGTTKENVVEISDDSSSSDDDMDNVTCPSVPDQRATVDLTAVEALIREWTKTGSHFNEGSSERDLWSRYCDLLNDLEGKMKNGISPDAIEALGDKYDYAAMGK